MRIASTTLAFLFSGAASLFAQTTHPDMTPGPSGVKWGPAPPSLPAGAQIAVLSGDPSKEGSSFVVRLKMPAGYEIAAHHHPTVENVTVLSGNLHAGMGDKLDKGKATVFEPGGFVSMPANMNHYAWATQETILQIHGAGPFQVIYVTAADDPSKK